jgi:two-component system, response regulator, stage 0 sporulation protein F
MLFEVNFSRNYDIITALSGIEALEKLRKIPGISVVISDMRMPGMNGIEFISLARKEFPAVYYFILTGYDITPEIANALNNQLILKYFRKPFNAKDIEKSIELVIKQI